MDDGVSRNVSTPWRVVRHYWRVARAKPWHVALPLTLTLIANAFDGASLALIIPLTEAVAENSFDFLETSRGFGWLLYLVPESLNGSPNRDAYIVGLVVALLLVGRIGKLAAQYLGRLFVMSRSEGYRVKISRETFGRVLLFGRQYFDRQALGRIDTEIGWSNSVLSLLVAAETIFRHVVAIVVKGAIMFAISVPLLIAFVVALPIVKWIVASINRAVRRIAEEGVEIDRRMRTQILDILGSVPLVKAYSQEQTAVDAYSKVLREGKRVAIRRDRVIGMRYPIEELTILTVMMLAQGAVAYSAGGGSALRTWRLSERFWSCCSRHSATTNRSVASR